MPNWEFLCFLVLSQLVDFIPLFVSVLATPCNGWWWWPKILPPTSPRCLCLWPVHSSDGDLHIYRNCRLHSGNQRNFFSPNHFYLSLCLFRRYHSRSRFVRSFLFSFFSWSSFSSLSAVQLPCWIFFHWSAINSSGSSSSFLSNVVCASTPLSISCGTIVRCTPYPFSTQASVWCSLPWGRRRWVMDRCTRWKPSSMKRRSRSGRSDDCEITLCYCGIGEALWSVEVAWCRSYWCGCSGVIWDKCTLCGYVCWKTSEPIDVVCTCIRLVPRFSPVIEECFYNSIESI